MTVNFERLGAQEKVNLTLVERVRVTSDQVEIFYLSRRRERFRPAQFLPGEWAAFQGFFGGRTGWANLFMLRPAAPGGPDARR